MIILQIIVGMVVLAVASIGVLAVGFLGASVDEQSGTNMTYAEARQRVLKDLKESPSEYLFPMWLFGFLICGGIAIVLVISGLVGFMVIGR